MIEEDLDALAALFHADGEGLPRQDVDRILNPIHELLTVLQIDTPILVDNFKQARRPCMVPLLPALLPLINLTSETGDGMRGKAAAVL